MANVGIIGWGVVGQATGEGLRSKHRVLWHDPYREGGVSLEELVESSEFIFVCVPTPMFSDHSGIDLSIVEEVVGKLARLVREQVIIIKSTVLPGTTVSLHKKHPDLILAVNPEFLTEARAFEDFLKPDRTIIGAFDPEVSERIRALYEAILPPTSVYFLTDPTSAELAKYASNITLAARVAVANEISLLAGVLGVKYSDIRDMVSADPRIGPAMLKVPGHDGNLGFGGKCLPKDTVALLSLGRELGVELPAIEGMWESNLRVRKNRDWEEISGAVTKKED